MQKLLAIFGTTLTLLAHNNKAFADPNDSITKLMNQPISYFDYGMDQLNRNVEGIAEKVYSQGGSNGPTQGRYIGKAEYDWNTSKIGILLTRFTDLNEDPNNFEEECHSAIEVIRREGGIDFSTYKLSAGMPYSFFAQLFMPKYYSVGDLPSKEVGDVLDSLLTVTVKIVNPANRNSLICTGNLRARFKSISMS